ncbi:MAG TPA: hypothetical protein VGX97_02070 [bacterium]|nr:hypothetical protein [bacterium]
MAAPDGAGLNQVKIWDLRSGRAIRVIDSHESFGINALAFSPDGRFLAGGGYDHVIRIWDVSTGALRLNITRNETGSILGVSSLAWSTDGRILASASGAIGEHNHSDKRITLWDPVTGAVRGTLGDELELIHVVALSPDGRMAAGGTIKFVMVGVWDLRTGKQIHFFAKNEGFITSLAFSPDSKYLASSSYDPVVWLWRIGMRP